MKIELNLSQQMLDKLNAGESITITPEQAGAMVWKPGTEELYEYIDSGGRIDRSRWNDLDYWNDPKSDEARWLYGNVYPLDGSAERASTKRKALVAIDRWQKENRPFVPDWEDAGQDKYFIAWHYTSREFVVDYWMTQKPLADMTYFASEQDALDCIAALPDVFEVLREGR